jgi:fructosamine-3-kinase
VPALAEVIGRLVGKPVSELFGTPLLDHVLGAYREQAQDVDPPLQEGWEVRVHLHQLCPLLLRAAVFGGGYAHDVLTAVRGALR